MANKSNIVREYLNNIGVKNQVFFFFGKTSTTRNDDTAEASIDVWKNSDLSYKVARKDSIAVVPNVTWSAGNLYKEWSSKITNTGNYYAWNRTNGIVYLCISNNGLNRKDLSLTSVSTQIPNHANGIRKYSDGYSWLPLYKITSDLTRFVSTTWIPVISFDDYRTNDTSRYSRAQSFCSNNQSANGYCGVYAKQALQIPSGVSTFTNYSAGDLVASFETTCSNCYYLYENDDRFVSVFGGSTPAATITVKSKFDEIGDLISRGGISRTSPYYALYQIANNGLDDGAIVSAFLDLTGFTQSNLVSTRANPEITITSNSGSNGRIRFTTYVNLDGENIINGVEIIANGSDYIDYALTIDSSLFPYLSGAQVTALLAAIDINLDTIDGLNFDPVTALSSENIMFDIRIETNILKRDGIPVPEEINFYGIVENPKEVITGTQEIVSGTQYGKDYSYSESVVPKVTVSTFTLVVPGDTSISATTTSGKVLSNLEISKVDEISLAQKNVYLKNIKYTDAENLSSVTVDASVFPVVSVEIPSIKQYTGKVTQTKKLASALKLGNDENNAENTKIFRINIVKGF